ncbi:hypothetical protein HMI56_001363, partial [Coelomomyces lativittatus]
DTYQRNVLNVPPQVLLDFAASRLNGNAATFYEANQEQYKEGEPKCFKNWDELNEGLKKQYLASTSSTPAHEYGEKLQQLFSTIDVLPEAVKVSYFMQGLNGKTREMISNSKENLETFDAALEAAASYESTTHSSNIFVSKLQANVANNEYKKNQKFKKHTNPKDSICRLSHQKEYYDQYRTKETSNSAIISEPLSINFIVDNGSSRHMVKDDSLLTDIESIHEEKIIVDGKKLNAIGKGTFKGKFKNNEIILKNVLVVPNLNTPLLSVSQCIKDEISISFEINNKVYFNFQGTSIMQAT